MKWRPISEAPRGRKVIAGYHNALGNWRTIMAMYYPPRTLELEDDMDDTDEGFAPEGWYELCENADTIRLTEEEPTHWMPLPEPPEADNE